MEIQYIVKLLMVLNIGKNMLKIIMKYIIKILMIEKNGINMMKIII